MTELIIFVVGILMFLGLIAVSSSIDHLRDALREAASVAARTADRREEEKER